MVAKAVCFICLLFDASLHFQLIMAQEVKQGSAGLAENEVKAAQAVITGVPSTSLFLELGGKGAYSFNVDFRRDERRSVSIGLQLFDEWIPSIMYYHFGGAKRRFEAGGGCSGVITTEGLVGMMVHGVIGYRYLKKKGVIFRAGFTPLYGIPFNDTGEYKFIPLAGLSIGYCF